MGENQSQTTIRTEDVTVFGFIFRAIYGLDIFHVNEVDVGFEGEPLTVFLKSLVRNSFAAVHMGYLENYAATPEELFGDLMSNHLVSPTSLFYSKFFDNTIYTDGYPSVLFPSVNENFWTEKLEDNSTNLVDVLADRAVSVYVSNTQPDLEKIRSLISKGLDHEEWVKRILEIYKLIVMPDNFYIYVYAKKEEDFELLEKPLNDAVEKIKQNQWFETHKNELFWDDNRVCCLRLKNE